MTRVYVSSTYSDLKDHREVVYRTLRQMGHDVIAMENYVATDQRPVDKCLADVTACDVVESRLETAKQLGACRTIGSKEPVESMYGAFDVIS